jgi:hypothetical protein
MLLVECHDQRFKNVAFIFWDSESNNCFSCFDASRNGCGWLQVYRFASCDNLLDAPDT